MKKQQKNKHTFAFYLEDLQYYLEGVHIGDVLTIEDKEISSRAGKILRLFRGDTCVFFDQYRHITCEVIICSKSIFQVTILAITQNIEHDPYITVLLPILKRDALETVVYNLTEIGVNKIQLIEAQKVQRKWGGQKEYDRLQKIIIAAAEQSKNFAYPDISLPMKFTKALEHNPGMNIYFDDNCPTTNQMIQDIQAQFPQRITCIVGPEGGLSPQELMQVQKADFKGYSLTPTVLRALQAATLGAGIIRSVINRS